MYPAITLSYTESSIQNDPILGHVSKNRDCDFIVSTLIQLVPCPSLGSPGDISDYCQTLKLVHHLEICPWNVYIKPHQVDRFLDYGPKTGEDFTRNTYFLYKTSGSANSISQCLLLLQTTISSDYELHVCILTTYSNTKVRVSLV